MWIYLGDMYDCGIGEDVDRREMDMFPYRMLGGVCCPGCSVIQGNKTVPGPRFGHTKTSCYARLLIVSADSQEKQKRPLLPLPWNGFVRAFALWLRASSHLLVIRKKHCLCAD